MKRLLACPMVAAAALLIALQLFAGSEARAAADLADGDYTIDYVITKPENESVSMANDYFEKPAVLQVKDGKISMRIQMNHSKWITVFRTPAGGDYADAEVVASDSVEDTRIVRFNWDDLSRPMLSKIHVTVPEIDYDHDYTIRFVFDPKTVKSAKPAAGESEAAKPAPNGAAADKPAAPAGPSADKPQSGAAAGGPAAPANSPAVPVNSPPTPANSPTASASADAGTGRTGPAAAATAAVSASTAGDPGRLNPQTGDSAPILLWASLLCLSGLFLIGQRRAGKRGGKL